jgi:transcription initiation factor TFIID subunit 6
VSNALVSGPEVVRSTALHAVAHNPGLQPLLPYLVQFISDEVVEQIKSSSRLAVALRLLSALLTSPHLHIEPFAHQVTKPTA